MSNSVMRNFFAKSFSVLELALTYSVFAISGLGVILAKTFFSAPLVNPGAEGEDGLGVHSYTFTVLVHCFDLSLLYAVICSKPYTVPELGGTITMGLSGRYFGSLESVRLSAILSLLINPWVFPGV